MKKIFLFFIGYACASVSEKDIKKFTSLLFGRGVNVFFGKRKKKKRAMSEENTDTGNCVRVIKYREKDHDVICGICAEEGIKLYDVKFYGIPQLFRRYGKRYGFYVGISVFIAALMFANNYVWRIEIYGNEKLTDEEVIDELERNGFRVGTNYKDVDFDVFHNRFLAASEDIAWLSVNMNGSVAYVEIREFLPEKEKENADENKGANILLRRKNNADICFSRISRRFRRRRSEKRSATYFGSGLLRRRKDGISVRGGRGICRNC